MHRILTYCGAAFRLVVFFLLISGCEREPAVDHLAGTRPNESLYQSNIVKLDSIIFTNPVWINGNVRFDINGTPPFIKAGDIVFFPGGEGICGKVVSATSIGSRMVFQLEKSGLDQIFRSISIQDTTSKSALKSRTRAEASLWNSDTMRFNGFFLFDDFWQSKILQVKISNGKLYSKSSLGQMFLSGQGTNPWFDRFSLDFNYSLDLDAEMVIKTGIAMNASDSLLVEKTIYGPFTINGFPITYQVDTWLGFHVVTARDTVITIKLSGVSKGNLLLNYNYWESWNLSENNQIQSADIQMYTGPRLSSYLFEVFVNQVISPIFCGEPSLSVMNRFNAQIKSDVAIPNWQSLQTVSTKGTLLRSGKVFSDYVPAKLSTAETLLYSETQNGVLENQPPKASFAIKPLAGFTDTNFEFDASASSDLENTVESLMVRWDFDGDNHFDTEFSTDKLAFHKYPQPGIYLPILEVRDAGGLTARLSSSVEVSLSSSAPVAYFTVTPESGRITDVYYFNADQSYDISDMTSQLKVRWDYDGDGIWDTNWSTRKIEYSFFRAEGKYVPKLEVKNTLGLTGSTTRIVNVLPANLKPTAFFTVDPVVGTTETLFNFDASGSTDPEDPSESLEVRWDWENDGTFDTGYQTVKTIQHTFAEAGTYTVLLEVIDTEGFGSSFTIGIQVSVPNTPPVADFSIVPESGTTELLYTFDASLCSDEQDSLDQLEVRWDWDNDGIYDSEFSSVKVYKRNFGYPGTYLIKLQVRDTGGLADTRVRYLVIQ